ncbi:glutamine amidotransferase [Microbacterium sp. LRZ72]|uniref:glutamine amidotransferase n=1 Tax=Microbacterium sp. LRZ72 TaxID=2942481 RepID=UPI0029A79E79|nr:glutamine amidotransferase [Microbacterium sp. LRZ72]MDX2377143.1 glutamine amidotransferase [Microbacterium sp. LRZ72]
MKPFLLLATRAEDVPADEEYALFRRFSGLDERDLVRVRLESAPMPPLDLDAYSGIIIGGGPFNASDPTETKAAVQRRVEGEISRLLDEVVARDFPLLGACYGIGTVGVHQGAIVDRTFGEPIGVAPVTLTDAGAADPVFAGIPRDFSAFVGHKEAVRELPEHAVLLASSPGCPVQAFRIGRNVYATQFHPELDLAGITTRIHAYARFGYFAADKLEYTLAAARRKPVVHTGRVLANFVARYAR